MGSKKGLFEVVLFLGRCVMPPVKPRFVITFHFGFVWKHLLGSRGVGLEQPQFFPVSNNCAGAQEGLTSVCQRKSAFLAATALKCF